MIREQFRILVFNLASGIGEFVLLDGRDQVAGGSGLAALLYERYGKHDKPWDDEGQPLIFTIGPLTGYFPLMSKTVCGFRSSYHNEYTESHGGGRTALALQFCNLDALVIVGKARRLSCLYVANRRLELKDVEFMRGMNADNAGKLLRRIFKGGSGHRSILRIGPSGEICSSMACINVDTYRHFGRMGGGATMGAKNLKGIVIHGEGDLELPAGKEYLKVYQEVYDKVTSTDMMRKYHNLGTAENLQTLNDIESLPWLNLQKTTDPGIAQVTGKVFADETLLRNGACAGCPVGCIHIGYIREKAKLDNRYHYHQVAYDYEPIFAVGTMLGVTDAFGVLRILDEIEKVSLDAMSAGVALAWATEAAARGLVSENETLIPLSFGEVEHYRQAAIHLGRGTNEFYRLLGQGTLKAAKVYGGEEFACVLGQEMAGYATGELYFAAQTLGFRHSHLDTGAYSYDQKHTEKDVEKAVEFLMADEPGRALLTSMVSCLFARAVYSDAQLAACLKSVGYTTLAENMDHVSENIRQLRWRVRAATGFRPENFSIPKRFTQVKTWKGRVDPAYMTELKEEYGRRIMALIDAGEKDS
ncbi:aldehyde ferredoxin oxidoreductase C-terminal domain-containing protein [Desulfopila aestuarii]|uniref:Aldehyde:ferredoxin oxidoreductase n=1 Tax=Desulfopila aestuarii DSM 18488 TaxID=1121416 RepID=A0A1M7Y9L7_9BACT|nr:aldehyde ferredoxin oxidoreductase C-terminal domain-containing protein [Desulfopila aestuarii]SHO49266.1 aldehyde:ferredoxin oxidoreductase [Desulfopila aestuarii DSM 18488]